MPNLKSLREKTVKYSKRVVVFGVLAACGTVGVYALFGPSPDVSEYKTCETSFSGSPCVTRKVEYDGDKANCEYIIDWGNERTNRMQDKACDGAIDEVIEKAKGTTTTYTTKDEIGNSVCLQASIVTNSIDDMLIAAGKYQIVNP